MSKIQRISLENFKSISDYSADFNGCTAIVTGKNNGGKTSFIRGIPDRIRFIRPSVIVKEGEEKGKGELVLDSGEKFLWEFNTEGKDKLTYITKDGARQSVTVALGERFFPQLFDIDKFLQSPPKKQAEQLQKIVGLDFADIDKRYAEAYAARTDANREAERYHVKLSAMLKVPRVEFVDLTDLQQQKEAERNRLNSLYKANKEINDKTRKAWEADKKKIDDEVSLHNELQAQKNVDYNICYDAYKNLQRCGYAGQDVELFLKQFSDKILPQRNAEEEYPKEPTDLSTVPEGYKPKAGELVYIVEMPDDSQLRAIDEKILKASETNSQAQEYKNYIDYKNTTDAAQEKARLADQLVKDIEAERNAMIASANMPKGIEITPDGILVDGLPLDKNQISTSKLYTSALRIASMGLGEVKTLHFDASYLDKNSLAEIEAWALENDLQLLIERPDFDAGEISYQIIQTHDTQL